MNKPSEPLQKPADADLDSKAVERLLWARNVTLAVLAARKGVTIRALHSDRGVGPALTSDASVMAYWLVHRDGIPVSADFTSQVVLCALQPIVEQRARDGELQDVLLIRDKFDARDEENDDGTRRPLS